MLPSRVQQSGARCPRSPTVNCAHHLCSHVNRFHYLKTHKLPFLAPNLSIHEHSVLSAALGRHVLGPACAGGMMTIGSGMHPPPMTCLYPPPHMTCMYLTCMSDMQWEWRQGGRNGPKLFDAKHLPCSFQKSINSPARIKPLLPPFPRRIHSLYPLSKRKGHRPAGNCLYQSKWCTCRKHLARLSREMGGGEWGWGFGETPDRRQRQSQTRTQTQTQTQTQKTRAHERPSPPPSLSLSHRGVSVSLSISLVNKTALSLSLLLPRPPSLPSSLSLSLSRTRTPWGQHMLAGERDKTTQVSVCSTTGMYTIRPSCTTRT